MLDLYSVDVHNNQQVAALPQLDRGSDYESERHRFESYTPHQLKSKASGNGGFSFTSALHGFEPRSRREHLNHYFVKFFQIVA